MRLFLPAIISSARFLSIFLYLSILTIYMVERGLPEWMISLVYAVYTLALIFLAPIIGSLSDRVGRKNIILIGLFFELIAVTMYIIDSHPVVFFIGRFLNSLGFIASVIISFAYFEDHVPSSKRTTYTGIFLTLESLGITLGSFLGAYLYSMNAYAPFMVSFFVTFALLLGTYMLEVKEKPTMASLRAMKKQLVQAMHPIRQVESFLGIKELHGVVTSMISIAIQNSLKVAIIPLFIVTSLGGSVTDVGAYMGITSIFGLFYIPIGHAVRRIGEEVSVIFSSIAIGVVFLLMSFATEVWQVLTLAVFLAIAMKIWNASAASLVAEAGEQQKKEGLVVGSFSSLGAILRLLSFLVFASLLSVVSLAHLLLGSALIMIASGLFSSGLMAVPKRK